MFGWADLSSKKFPKSPTKTRPAAPIEPMKSVGMSTLFLDQSSLQNHQLIWTVKELRHLRHFLVVGIFQKNLVQLARDLTRPISPKT